MNTNKRKQTITSTDRPAETEKPCLTELLESVYGKGFTFLGSPFHKRDTTNGKVWVRSERYNQRESMLNESSTFLSLWANGCHRRCRKIHTYKKGAGNMGKEDRLQRYRRPLWELNKHKKNKTPIQTEAGKRKHKTHIQQPKRWKELLIY